ncbi:LytR/AlgR family response regulator transcription factor [Sphingobacterium psychroaquaticum]|uniref:Two component transcriptional regulator, LytTR family n=1 Tax=Sphingobacterium psychroaquaticum TaxID=561061 RepID=A0A1X7KE86_9SPHI|nr:LytTR family DNA-binding domain-containing protein [Sphingobacterium psychroaquaticum]SMG39499.1 two component transcriptional regulator, LytTR family [Sphingobacterium psychroaquaticum]
MKVLVVDDDFHARKLLTHYIEKIPFLNLIGSCSDVFEAMGLMSEQQIDLLILDIQMPNMTGVEFSKSLRNGPLIIFSTAYSEYALEGFEQHAVDYLLKPVEFSRFLTACYKAKDRFDYAKKEIERQTEQNDPKEYQSSYFTVKDGTKFYKINYDNLLFVEGQREYVTFHTNRERITALYTLKSLEDVLPSKLFKRVHKSFIVSLQHIEMIEGNRLKISTHKIPIGASYKSDLLKLMV